MASDDVLLFDVSFADLGCGPREQGLFDAWCAANPAPDGRRRVLGRVIKLDRGYPLVCCHLGNLRCEHAVDFIKRNDSLACVGDWVVLALPQGHDMGIICWVLDRKESFCRKDPAERTRVQVLAANIDTIFVVHALGGEALNQRRLERELVVAHESGATPVVLLTKTDLSPDLAADVAAAQETAPGLRVLTVCSKRGEGVEDVRACIPAGSTAVLLGASGVGKSSLVNALVGAERMRTAAVRAGDDRGRHTTVARQLLPIPGGGVIIDTPGIRAVALWENEDGMAAAFPEIEEAAAGCRFRDCSHTSEPGCAVRAAVEAGTIPKRRLEPTSSFPGFSEPP